MKTAVEIAFEKLANQGLLITKDYKNLVVYKEAKEMEKEQIIETYKSGWYSGYNVAIDEEPEYKNAEQYYNETFKSKI